LFTIPATMALYPALTGILGFTEITRINVGGCFAEPAVALEACGEGLLRDDGPIGTQD